MLRFIIYARVGHADLIIKIVVAVWVLGSVAHTTMDSFEFSVPYTEMSHLHAELCARTQNLEFREEWKIRTQVKSVVWTALHKNSFVDIRCCCHSNIYQNNLIIHLRQGVQSIFNFE